VASVAGHLGWPAAKVQAAFNYAQAFPEEINRALAEHEAMNFATLAQMLPAAEEFIVGRPAGKR
jgi:hypothetical protein